MKLSEFTLDKRLIDNLPPPGAGAATAGATQPMATPGQAPVATDPQAAAKAQAMAAKQMQDRKKQIQDTIKLKQKEIMDLQKELASIK